MKVEYTGDIDDVIKTIKHIMIDKDLRQKDICAKTGWSKATVSNLLNCRTASPSLDVILALTHAVDCKLMLDISSDTV